MRCKRLFIAVELGLFPNVDLILRRSGKHVIQLPIVFHGRDPVLGKPIDRLLLLGGRHRYDPKARLRKQELFLGGNELGVVGGNGLAGRHQRQ